MTRSSTSRTQILSLSLAFLLTGLVACSKGSEGEEQTPTPEAGAAASGTTSAQPGQAASPASPGQPGTASPLPGQSGQPGQPATAPAPGQQPAAAVAPPADTSKMPAVVARVNGVEIKKDELLRQAEQMRIRYIQASQGRQSPPLDATFYKQILEGLVAQTLIVQDATRQGVTVGDQEVGAQIEKIKKQFPDAATFQKALASQGISEKALQDNVRQEVLIQKYVTTKIVTDITVDEQSIRQFYEENKDKMQGQVPFEQAKGSITQMLKQRQAGEKLQAHVEQLKKQGKVEVFL
jgi:peptidyl-prolyl cis-trans isomerase SurA